MLRKEKFVYGADIDGNRGEVREECSLFSDVSGKELKEGNIYCFDQELYSREELIGQLGAELKTASESLIDKNGSEIEPGEKYYLFDGDIYFEESFIDFLNDEYQIDFWDAVILEEEKQ